jgi:protocatechuate 3,4-dioxygenase beta subunit
MIPLLFALLAQTPTPAPQKCGIEGTVVSSTTGAPLRKVTITLEGGKNDLTATTSAEGKFKFENLEPSDYTIKAERVGYLEGPDTVLTLQPAELKTDFVLKLTPQAVISGRVLDEDGDPVLGGRVAYIRWVAAGEKKFKLEEDAQEVNGEGGFTLTGLNSGSYYLQAVPGRISGPPHPGEGFVITFYPNSLDLTGAATLTVAPGGEVRNIEIRMRKSPKFHVRGKVSIPPGAAGVPGQLELASDDSAEMSLGEGTSVAISNGGFEFEGVQPGSYILRSSPNVQTGSRDEGEFSWGSAHFFFRQPIEVTDRDIDDVTVAFRAAIDLSGVFHADGVKILKAPLVALVAANFSSMRQLKAESDLTGMFRFAQLPPDRFEVLVSNIPDGAYVRSIRHGAQEVKGSLDLTSGSGDPLEITFAPNAAEIGGTLRDAKGDPLPHRVVNLWTSEDEPTLFETTASDGSFHFKNLAPGDYHLAGWSNIDTPVKPAFRKIYESQAAAVTVHEGSRETADVNVIVVQ